MNYRRQQIAFTLPELMISLAILSILTTVLVLLYEQSYATVNRGTGRLALQQKARETVKRITPLVLSSFDNPDDGTDAMIEFPPQDANTYDNIVITTTEDWLASGYPSPTTSARRVTSIGAIAYVNYRIRLNGGDIVLERGTWNDAAGTFTPNAGESRTLGYSDDPRARDAVDFLALRVQKQAPNAIQVEVDVRVSVRNAAKQQEVINETITSIIQVPNASLRAL